MKEELCGIRSTKKIDETSGLTHIDYNLIIILVSSAFISEVLHAPIYPCAMGED